MGRNLIICFLSVWWSPTVFAACLTLDTSTWTPDQRRLLKEKAYVLAARAGRDEFPTFTNGQLCFQTFDPTGVVTEAGILAQYATDQVAGQAAQQAQQADDVDLATLEAQLDALYDGMTPDKKDSVEGKLLRADQLRRKLGR